jgi:dipeptidyl aminopeptidase/acylaminoacyl peptidase
VRSETPDRRALPYGTWSSPIAGSDVGRSHGSIAWLEQPDGEPWWVESDPLQGGALAILRNAPTGAVRITTAGANVRNRVHEYGGLPWAYIPPTASDARASVCYTEWSDHRVYRQIVGGGAPVPLTPMPDRDAGYRYAEPLVRGDEVWALREHHGSDSPTDVLRDFVAIPLDGSAADDPTAVRELGAGQERGAGHHFLAGLRVSPDGELAAWIGWNHPNMPWDGTELVVADIVDGVFVNPRVLAGGAEVSICQVEWDADGRLVYLSDESGWWNLHRSDLATGESAPILAVAAELGGPLWRPGLRWFAPLGGGRYGVLDHGTPGILDEATQTIEPIVASAAAGLPHWRTHLSVDENGRLASVGYGPQSLPTVVSVDATGTVAGVRLHGDHARPTVGATELGADWLPRPELTWFTGADGAAVPANVYPPHSPTTAGPASELPPFVVHIHGGPTGEHGVDLDLEIAYYTSRGIGVVAPEYGGSTGFGRAWRERLRGQWGVVDLADAETVAAGLVAAGVADPARLGIRGGSAGGFTSALAMTRPSSFAVGLVRYPVIDLLAWASGETHDFESQYLTGLIGPLPEAERLYRERSPSASGAHGPMLVLQGDDDRICLPVTTGRFVAELEAAGVPHRYVLYPGEQHGFRRAETIAHAIETEFEFFCSALGIARTENA